MFYRIKDGLQFCKSGDTFIFLDARKGRYFSLPARAQGAFARLIDQDGLASAEISQELRTLVDHGYLVAHDRRYNFVSAAAHKLTDCVTPSRSVSPPARLIVLAAVWQIYFVIVLHFASIASVLAKIPRLKECPLDAKEFASLEVAKVSAASKKVTWLFGETDRCLVLALSTCALLRARGVPCRFAIGVRARPFAAHAWVEWAGTVVNDDLENVRKFTPILVAE